MTSAAEARPDLTRHTASRQWMLRGLCATTGLDPDLWFPTPTDTDQAERAKAICQHCPVLDNCHTHVQTLPWVHGIWAATTQTERHTNRERTTP